MISPDEDNDEYSDFTAEEHRAVQLLGEELVRVVRRFHQRHPTIYITLQMGADRWRDPKLMQLTFFDLVPPP